MSASLEEINAAIAKKQGTPELQQINEAIAAKQAIPGTTADAIIEPVVTIASAIPASIVGGLGGAVQAMNPMAEEGAGEETLKSIQEAITVKPKTEAGKEGLQNLVTTATEITDLLSLGGMIPIVTGGVADILTGGDLDSAIKTGIDIQQKGMPKVVSDKVFQITESPLAATAVFMTPELGEMLLGGGLKKAMRPISSVNETIAKEIQSGSSIKGYVDKGAGAIVHGPAETKKIFKEAVKQGVDPGVATILKGSTPLDKKKMLSMLEVLKKGRKNRLYADSNRPADIAGGTMLERAHYVQKVNREAGKKLDSVALKLKGENVDISNITKKFAEKLDGFGVKLRPDNKGGFQADFTDAALAPGDFGTIKEVIRQMSRLNKKPIDGYAAHELKKIISRNVTFGKKDSSLSSETANMLKKYRHKLDEALDSRFPEYDDVNTTYAQTRTALDAFQDAAGQKMNLSGKNANKAVGTLLRRLTSNVQSRVPLMDAIDEVDTVARNFGGVFDDSVKVQMLLAEELDVMFQAAAKTSIQGEMGKAAKRAISQSKTASVLDAGAAVVHKIRGVTDENAIIAIEALLK